MAAALLIGKTFHTKNRSIQELRDRPNPRIPTFLCCQNQGDIDELESKTDKGKENRPLLLRVFAGVASFRRCCEVWRGVEGEFEPKAEGRLEGLGADELVFCCVCVYVSEDCLCLLCMDVHGQTTMVDNIELGKATNMAKDRF